MKWKLLRLPRQARFPLVLPIGHVICAVAGLLACPSVGGRPRGRCGFDRGGEDQGLVFGARKTGYGDAGRTSNRVTGTGTRDGFRGLRKTKSEDTRQARDHQELCCLR